MYLYNTATHKIEKFQPLKPPLVTYYTCGPTVYDYTHIGHMRTYVNNDLLKRALNYLGHQVKHVMNITDVGHLTGDDDRGEDKLEKGAKKQKKTVWEVAKFFTDYFFDTMDQLNIIRPDIVCSATDHVSIMVQIIELLQRKGFTYETEEAIYFDTAKFKNYGRLNPQKKEEKISGAREEVYLDPQKKQPADFALWFKRVGRFKNHTMHWHSPWGDGFPGWNIECSAMSMKYLGETIDIHSGGVDHIAIHHTNEIAESEAATGKPFVNYWFHNEHLLVNGKKMSKSLGNFYTLDDIKKRGIEPLALRYLFLQTHYRQQMNFTWQAVKAAQEGYNNLKQMLWNTSEVAQSDSSEVKRKVNQYHQRFIEAISNDLQIPQALAVAWEVIKSNLPSYNKYHLILDFDKIFGLGLAEIKTPSVPEKIIKLAKERELARQKKDFKKADQLRKIVKKLGYYIEDKEGGFKIRLL
jgi:cysteinyl-tRNA synthetase